MSSSINRGLTASAGASKRPLEVKRSGLLFCLVGPAGGGKTTLWEQLLTEFGDSIKLSVSVTSRTPRPQEREGVHYYFVSREEFEHRITRGEFFEWEETHGNYYGTVGKILNAAIERGEDLLLEVDIRGAKRFKRSFPESTVIAFILPPSMAELRQRIENRSSVSPEELQRRLATASKEYETLLQDLGTADSVDYIIVNDGFEQSYSQLRAILLAERQRVARISKDSVEALCYGGKI